MRRTTRTRFSGTPSKGRRSGSPVPRAKARAPPRRRGQWDVAQVSAPLEAGIARHQESPPRWRHPCRIRAVERHSDHNAREAIFGHAGGDVRVVVLHTEFRQPGDAQRVPGAEILRMKSYATARGSTRNSFFKLARRFFEEDHGLVVFEVADVLAQDGMPSFGEAEGRSSTRAPQASNSGRGVPDPWFGAQSRATGGAHVRCLRRCALPSRPSACNYRGCG